MYQNFSKTRTAILLAAGKGQRLDRHDSPKPLVKVGHKPMILWNIEQLQDAGIQNIYIIVGHRGDEIKKALINHPEITANINYIEQRDSTNEGMLKSFLMIRDIVKEPFYLTMADLIIGKNPYLHFQKIEDKDSDECVYLMVDTNPDHFKRSGALSRIYMRENKIYLIDRELSDYNALEIGIYYFSKKGFEIFKQLDSDNNTNNFSDILQLMINKQKVNPVILSDCEWFDVNTPATHTRAEIFARKLQDISVVKKERNNMKELDSFNSFYRKKLLHTNIFIEQGLISNLNNTIIIPERYAGSPHFIITDSVVDQLYGDKVLDGFTNAGYKIRKLVVPAGEKSKNIGVYGRLADEIFSFGMDERSILISLGGGVVNNIAGFLASTLYRGIGLIHIPTTMMAQVDAAIDFKQAVNSAKGKNLLGSYWPAMSIVIDPEVLLSLDARHINNGIAESIKHALIQDAEFLQYFYDNSHQVTDINFLEQVIRRTVELKVPLLNGETNNDYNEMLPQYGHSVSHTVEHLSSYDLLHGEALAIGMCVCAEVANLLGICKKEVVDHHYKVCSLYNLPTIIPDYISDEDICNSIKFDKHYLKGNPHMALIEKVGEVWNDNGIFSAPIDYSVLKRAININKNKKKIYE